MIYKSLKILSTTTLMIASSAHAATNFTGSTNTDWNTASNWSPGGGDPAGVPSGVVDVIINSGETAIVNSATTPSYTGSLTLLDGAVVDMRGNDADYNALGTATITLNTNSSLFIRTGGDPLTITNNIIFAGDASILNLSNPTDNEQRSLTGVLSGSGQFTYGMRRGNLLSISGDNTMSGGFIANFTDTNFGNMSRIRLNANGALGGAGDVIINDGIGLEISALLGDTISNKARLFLNGRGRNGKLVLESDETVGGLVVNGVGIGRGVYDSTSGLLDGFGNNLISGTGTLTVLPEPSSTALLGLAGLSFILRRRR